MSTDFVPGQNARAIRNTASADGISVVKGAQVTVEALPSAPFPTFVGSLESETGLVFDTADFEPVEPPEPFATPDPLDPSAVKAGDTVTIVGTKAKVEGEVLDVQKDTDAIVILTIDNLRFMVAGPGADHWTLTDHQPAPKPAPKPGTTGTATVNGESVRGLIGRNDNQDGDVFAYWNELARHISLTGTIPADFVPDEPRAVWSRPGLHAALVHDDSLKVDPGTGMRYIDPDLAVERLAAYLRGESR